MNEKNDVILHRQRIKNRVPKLREQNESITIQYDIFMNAKIISCCIVQHELNRLYQNKRFACEIKINAQY